MLRLKPTVVTPLLLALNAAWAADLDLARPITEQIAVKRSEFDSATHYAGPELMFRTPQTGPFPDTSERLYVALHVAKPNAGGRPQWEIVLQAIYTGTWRFYKSASMVGGGVVPGASFQRTTLGCYRASCQLGEAVSFPLSPEIVDASIGTGLRLRFNGERYGTFAAEVPAAYFGAMQEVLKR